MFQDAARHSAASRNLQKRLFRLLFLFPAASREASPQPRRDIKMDQGTVQSCAVVALIRQLVELLRECYLNMLIPTWPVEERTRVRGASILVLCGSPLVSVSGTAKPAGPSKLPRRTYKWPPWGQREGTYLPAPSARTSKLTRSKFTVRIARDTGDRPEMIADPLLLARSRAMIVAVTSYLVTAESGAS